MKIKIRTEKVIMEDGNKGRKILELEASSQSELPVEYWSNPPSFRYCSKCASLERFIKGGMDYLNFMTVDQTYPEPLFQKELDFIRVCGDKLHEINLKNRWHGEEEFTI